MTEQVFFVHHINPLALLLLNPYPPQNSSIYSHINPLALLLLNPYPPQNSSIYSTILESQRIGSTLALTTKINTTS